MSNKIRYCMKEEVEAILPLLHETYMRIGRFQKKRNKRNEALVHTCLDRLGPALQVFKPILQYEKRAYFDVLLKAEVSTTDRIIALDTAVGALHIEFSVPRMYMHQESEELREALEACRISSEFDVEPELNESSKNETAICKGVPASPGLASGEVFKWNPSISFEHIPNGCIIVSRMTRPEIVVCARRISGIVTDIGGALCHAAILALEFGIPCVVGTSNATTALATGMLVSVDGTEGKIYKL